VFDRRRVDALDETLARVRVKRIVGLEGELRESLVGALARVRLLLPDGGDLLLLQLLKLFRRKRGLAQTFRESREQHVQVFTQTTTREVNGERKVCASP